MILKRISMQVIFINLLPNHIQEHTTFHKKFIIKSFNLEYQLKAANLLNKCSFQLMDKSIKPNKFRKCT